MDKVELITQEEFVESIIVNGRLVNVGLDDYGQQYFFQYVDDTGELKEVGCGSYNTNYRQEIEDYFKILDKSKDKNNIDKDKYNTQTTNYKHWYVIQEDGPLCKIYGILKTEQELLDKERINIYDRIVNECNNEKEIFDLFGDYGQFISFDKLTSEELDFIIYEYDNHIYIPVLSKLKED